MSSKASIYDREEERKELRKLIDHYQAKADRYEYEYQLDGLPRQYQAWQRNERMAEALRNALNGKDTLGKYHDLRLKVLDLNTSEPEKLIGQVKYLQKAITEGGA